MAKASYNPSPVKTADGLPEMCWSRRLSDNQPILIKRGVDGYYVTDYPVETDLDVLNKRLGVSKAQVSAMEMGSMFGWHVPGADPKSYEERAG